VLKGVSLAIEEGTSVALLGGSGSGKTTLAKCLVGLQQPDSGSIAIDGVNVYPATTNRKRVGIRIQMLFQGVNASLDPTMTAWDTLAEGIAAGAGKSSTRKMREEAERLVGSVGIPGECLERYPHQLSGGQRQRIALARVLSVAPRLLILDEPTSALDVLTSAQMLQVLKSTQRNEGFSILYITHDVRMALSFCDRVAVLHDGVIVEEGQGGDLLKHPKHPYTHQLLRDSRIM
jgi:peptide/nickel transport system ATP-binding protein